jgi:hypothetical protein
MAMESIVLNRRTAALLIASAGLALTSRARGAGAEITVHKDPNCGCCTGWAQHLTAAGYAVKVVDTADLNAIKTRLRVPKELAACHTAEVAGYVLEGHVPAEALRKLLTERPQAIGLSVPGMPVGSPGMEGGNPQPFAVILFSANARNTYMRFLGAKAI